MCIEKRHHVVSIDARKHNLRGFKIAKQNRLAATRLGHRLCIENAIMPLVDARKTSLTGVKNSSDRRRVKPPPPPWKKARSAPGGGSLGSPSRLVGLCYYSYLDFLMPGHWIIILLLLFGISIQSSCWTNILNLMACAEWNTSDSFNI